jgi:inner membrane protein
MMFGACLARSGFNRNTALATAVMTIAAEIPDLDIFTEVRGPVFGFQHHRGATHAFLGVPFDAAAALLIVYAVHRFRRSRRQKQGSAEPQLAPRWGLLYLLACIAGLSHILLDFTNAYGVRPLMPFSYRWHHWDIVSIVEPFMWAVLFFALILPSLFSLINSEIGARSKGPRGRAAAIAALLLVAVMWGVRDYEHRRALAALNAIEYDGDLPRRVSAYATTLNIFAWNAVVETDSAFRIMPVDSLTPEVDPRRQARIFYKPPMTPPLQAAKASYLGRAFLDWAEYPVFEIRQLRPGEDVEDEISTAPRPQLLRPVAFAPQETTDEQQQPAAGCLVRMYDLRYFDVDSALRGRRRILGGTVQLDRELHPVAYYMGSFFGRSVQRAR